VNDRRAALLTRIGIAVFAVVSIASLAFAIAWALVTMRTRPLDGVEGEIVFEAIRLREKRALYIDPIVGDLSYGAPATRYFVLYPPLMSALVSLVPSGDVPGQTMFVRSLSLSAWICAVAAIARLRASGAPRARAFTWVCASFVLGSYALDLYGASGRPDALALFLAATALARAAGKGKVDALAGALFALAAFVKPNVVGLGAGAIVASIIIEKRRALPGVLGLVGTAGVIACILHVESGGLFVPHLLASTAQHGSLSLWLDQMASRLPFFLAPLALAAAVGVRHRKDPSTFIGLCALVSSFAWAIVSLAKIGSASNYWMEPCLAALCIVARAPSLDLGRATPLAAVVLAIQAPYDGVATARSSVEGIARASEQRRVIDELRASCRLSMADEPGMELELDGRVLDTPFQFAHRADPALENAWAKDVDAPSLTCLVVGGDELERTAAEFDELHDRFTPKLKKSLRARFALEKTDAGLSIYRAR
jgi:hypothetical protein